MNVTLARALAAFALLLAIVQAVALFAMAFRPSGLVYGLPFSEDGFYALTIARNLASGRGITIDGATWTNGFQPFFTFLEAICFKIAGGLDIRAGRLVILLSWLVHVWGAILAALVARDARIAPETRMLRAIFAALLYLAAAKFSGDFYTGLETGLQLAMILMLWRAAQRGAIDSAIGCVGFGVIIGLAVLARIDVGFLAVALAVWVLARGWIDVGPVALLRPLAMAASAAAISAPWWLYNRFVFGAYVPSSGTAQQHWALDIERIREGAWALRMVLVPWIFTGDRESLATDLVRSAILLLLLAIMLFAPFGRRRANTAPESVRTRGFALCLVAAMAALIVFYVGSFYAYWFYFRYFAPLSLLMVIWLAVALGSMAERGVAGSFAATLVLLVAVATGLVAPVRTVLGTMGPSTHFTMVELVRQTVPENEVVAAGQSGTLGFFRARVVNVDGKVNPEALAWQSNMWNYLAERDIRWFVDSPWFVERMLGPDPGANGWSLVAVAGDDAFRVYRRETPARR